MDSQHNIEYNRYRVVVLKVFGGVQIGLGIGCGILSLAGIIFDCLNLGIDCEYYTYSYRTNSNYGSVSGGSSSSLMNKDCEKYAKILIYLDTTTSILSGWFVFTGIFPLFINKNRQSSWRCLKITFMVLSIIGAVVIVPVVFGIAICSIFFREGSLVAISGILACVSFFEFVIAIVAASFCCCCSPFGTSTSRSQVYITNVHNGTTVFSMTPTNQPLPQGFTQGSNVSSIENTPSLASYQPQSGMAYYGNGTGQSPSNKA